MDLIDRCREVISIDSSPSAGTSEIAGYFENYAQSLGLFIEKLLDVYLDVEQVALLCSTPHTSTEFEKDPQLILQSYLDTLEPGPFGQWEKTAYNPFNGLIIDQKLYGLGALDGKIDLLCKLKAIDNLQKKNIPLQSALLIGTYGQNLGMTGALKLIRKRKIPKGFAFVGSATGLRLALEGMGVARLEFEVFFSEAEIQWRQQHDRLELSSSETKLLKSDLESAAIDKVFDFLKKLPRDTALLEIDAGLSSDSKPSSAILEIDPQATGSRFLLEQVLEFHQIFEKIQFEMKSYASSPEDCPTLSLGRIKTTERSMIFSGVAQIPPSVSLEDFDTWMNQIIAVAQRIRGEFRVKDYRRPYRTSERASMVKKVQSALLELNLETEPIRASRVNEASLWSRVNVECVTMGPGRWRENLPLADQFVELEQLHKAVQFYELILKKS